MKKQLIYAGTRISNNKIVATYFELLDPEKLGNLVTFPNRLVGVETVGAVIDTEVDDTGKTYSNWGLSEIKIDNPVMNDYIANWSVEQRMSRLTMERIREAKKEHPQSIETLVDEIQSRLGHYSRRERASLALWIYNKII